MTSEEAQRLREQLDSAFCKETSFSGDAYQGGSDGHCAVVALIVWARFGGSFVSTYHFEISHWYNRIGDLDVDLTGDQFGLDPVQIKRDLYPGARIRKLEDVNDETIKRAITLAEKADLGGLVETIRGLR